MKMLNSILCLAIATHCWAEDNILKKQAFSSTENAAMELPVICENPEARRNLNLGLQNCILNYPEKAEYHFQTAITADSSCLLAHVGMLMVSPAGSAAYKSHLSIVNQLIEAAVLTPIEEWYLSVLLQYISGDLHGAAAAFKQRASIYRRDVMASCWDILLNHYAAEQGGDITFRADKLVDKYPENPIVHYLRALLDEYIPVPTENGLSSAVKCSELLPECPNVHLLSGHLLMRSGNHNEALKHFQNAQKASQKDLSTISAALTGPYCTAVLAEICTRWQLGNKMQALQICSQLLKKRKEQSERAGDAYILMLWEAGTLPLRLLVLQASAPSGAAINAAAAACAAPADSPLVHVQNCLVEAIRTRALADTGRISSASLTLTKAEQHLKLLLKQKDEINHTAGLTLSCYNRSVRTCQGAIYRAKLALYKDSQTIWQPHLDEVTAMPEPRFLPPVLPKSEAAR